MCAKCTHFNSEHRIYQRANHKYLANNSTLTTVKKSYSMLHAASVLASKTERTRKSRCFSSKSSKIGKITIIVDNSVTFHTDTLAKEVDLTK